MPSPFPGMDPYLEHPAHWPGFHHIWISVAAGALNAELKPRGYYVNIDERIWLEDPERHVYPDLAIVRRAQPRPTTAVAPADADEPIRVRPFPVEIKEGFLEIVDTSTSRVITGIELLSPANKIPTKGRRLFHRKQRELRRAGVNLVELDFLRSGRHALSVSKALADSTKPWDYLALIQRSGQPDFELYRILLRAKLPRVRIPLKENDPDVVLDLQSIMNTVYDQGPYPERLDYEAPATPPLSPDDAAWADGLLRQAGLRK